MIEALRVQSVGGYRPGGEDRATVTGIFWDSAHHRVALSLVYKNGLTDWVPASEVETLGIKALGNFPYILRHKE